MDTDLALTSNYSWHHIDTKVQLTFGTSNCKWRPGHLVNIKRQLIVRASYGQQIAIDVLAILYQIAIDVQDYHWLELPQVSFCRKKDACLSRQAYFCRDKRRVLSRQTRVCATKVSLSRQKKILSRQTFFHDKHIFVVFIATKVLSRQIWYLWRLSPMIQDMLGMPNCSCHFGTKDLVKPLNRASRPQRNAAAGCQAATMTTQENTTPGSFFFRQTDGGNWFLWSEFNRVWQENEESTTGFVRSERHAWL